MVRVGGGDDAMAGGQGNGTRAAAARGVHRGRRAAVGACDVIAQLLALYACHFLRTPAEHTMFFSYARAQSRRLAGERGRLRPKPEGDIACSGQSSGARSQQ